LFLEFLRREKKISLGYLGEKFEEFFNAIPFFSFLFFKGEAYLFLT